jgi:hypothetical protein
MYTTTKNKDGYENGKYKNSVFTQGNRAGMEINRGYDQ